MKKHLLLPALIGILLFTACKKNNDEPSTGSGSLPKTYTEDVRSTGFNSLTTYNLTYDGNNRITSMTSIPEPAIVKFVYKYSSNNSLTMDLYNSNVLSIHEILWLNTSGTLDSTFQFDDTSDTTTEKYVYNSGKQLLHIKDYNYSATESELDHTISYTYDNLGNAIAESSTDGTLTNYTYYTDLPNTLTMGQTFTPQAKNLIKTASSSSSGTPVTATHFYTFDSGNRLIKDSAVTTGVSAILIKSYTY
jgi:YD repeat-containing protein